MTRSDLAEYERLSDAVVGLRERGELPTGIRDPVRADVFVRQLVESLRRVRYISLISQRSCGPRFADPDLDVFDPLRALVHLRDLRHVDEAFWMAFLHVHFGKNLRWGWEYPRRIYGALGQGFRWTWNLVSADPKAFRFWLSEHEIEISDGPGGFGNHRKYESLSGSSGRGTGAAVESYVRWVCGFGSHPDLVEAGVAATGGEETQLFDWLAKAAASEVVSFGRTAGFDYANLLAWTGLVPARAGTCHISGATGPRSGAEEMYGLVRPASEHERDLAMLCDSFSVPFDVMEDALCNWQKSPGKFKPFRG